MGDNKKSFVTFEPKGRTISVTWSVNTRYRETKSGKLACYMTSFEIYFSAKDIDTLRKKNKQISTMFFDHFFIHSGKRGIRNLALQLHKLGYRAKDDAMVLKSLLHDKPIHAKFKSGIESVPSEFYNSENIVEESQMEVEI